MSHGRREAPDAAQNRWKRLEYLQGLYPEFGDFLQDVMHELGFSTTDIQLDIGDYIAYGPENLMIQAQRSQAKTTIAAAYCVYSLIHNPQFRVLIVSAGGTQATEISTLIVKIILTMDVLEPLRPDKTAGDRTSVEAFDVHHSLKGIDKSPSVACVGITSNLQGKRADILLADDVESAKNSLTQLMREQLTNLTKDFSSICQYGRIIYLGTPQTNDSIYNTLPGRGFSVRIWPGRYPTPDQVENYGEFLAPLLKQRIIRDPTLQTGGGMLGDQGKPIDPVLMGEAALQKKELDQGAAYFQLQHMLNTRLSDAMRYPLKTENLLVLPLRGAKHLPLEVHRSFGSNATRPHNVGSQSFRLGLPGQCSEALDTPQFRVMYIDPAGGGANGDETAYAVGDFLNGNVFLRACSGLPGGYELPQLGALADVIAFWQPNTVVIEKNLGFGAFKEVLLPVLRTPQADGKARYLGAIADDYVTGQKELRIIATLEPVLGRGALIIDEAILQQEAESLARYSTRDRISYSLFFQMARITRDRGALAHDDRLDAVEGLIRFVQAQLAQDQTESLRRREEAERKKWLSDPLGHGRYDQPKQTGAFARRRR